MKTLLEITLGEWLFCTVIAVVFAWLVAYDNSKAYPEYTDGNQVFAKVKP
jgi:hypothetical protein